MKDDKLLGEDEAKDIELHGDTEELKKEMGIIDNETLALLDAEDEKKQYLGIGETGGFWYYGFNLAGREAIVTSDRKIIRNTEERTERGQIIGENGIRKFFDYSDYIGDIAPSIHNDTIKKFVLADKPLINPKELFREIRDKILYFMDFGEQGEIADVQACWILATFVYPLFYWFPHIFLNAPSDSGKSKDAYLITNLSFRGFDLGACGGVTPAQIFRTIEGNYGTMCLDEFESRFGKGAEDSQQLVNQILNASVTRDAYVIRTEQVDKTWVSRKFPIFCPKIASNISGLNPVSLSRFIAFKWLKTSSEKGKRKPYTESEKKKIEELREKGYIFGLENFKQIKGLYDLPVPDLNNRVEDNWKPILSIARLVDSSEGENVDAEQQVLKYLKTYSELEIETNDTTEEFFQILWDVIDEAKYYTPTELAEITEIRDLLSYLHSPANWIGRKLKLYSFKTTRGGGIRKYLLSKESIEKILNLYYKTTHNDTNNTQPHKQHITTLNDVSLCGVSVVMGKGGKECYKCKSKDNLAPIEDQFDQEHKTIWVCSRCQSEG